MKKIVWNGYNKANWSLALNAVVLLINGRLPPDIALSAQEQGWLMVALTYLVVSLFPNINSKEVS